MLLPLVACAPETDRAPPESEAPASLAVNSESPPVADDSGEASLALDHKGNPVLTWIETGPDARPRLQLSIREPEGWTAPRTIAEGRDWFVNWADFPSLGRNDSLWAVHWLARLGDSPYAYGVKVSASTDAGRHWSEPLLAHADDSPTEHGFVSYFPEGDGGIGMVWLDGRNTEDGRAMTLRTARLIATPEMTGEQVLDDRVCDCCQTDAAVTADGPVVVYRDRGEAEIRDISIVRRVDGAWTDPERVARDEWQISACPVNGPAVAARDRRVAVAWFTGAAGPRVKLAFSQDSGATFSPPMVLDRDSPLGRVDAAWLADERLAVSYMDREGAEAVIRVGIVDNDTVRFIDIGRTSAARSSGFPRLVANDAGLWIAWREVDANGATVRVSRVTI